MGRKGKTLLHKKMRMQEKSLLLLLQAFLTRKLVVIRSSPQKMGAIAMIRQQRRHHLHRQKHLAAQVAENGQWVAAKVTVTTTTNLLKGLHRARSLKKSHKTLGLPQMDTRNLVQFSPLAPWIAASRPRHERQKRHRLVYCLQMHGWAQIQQN